MSAVPADYDAAYRSAVCFDISDLSKIELVGPETRMFLHNLCTNDVKSLASGAGCEIFLTTNKARIVGHGVVGAYALHDGEVLLLDSEPNQAERLLQHLNHFLISEQVELADRTADWALFRIVGPNAAESLSALVGGPLDDLPVWHHRKWKDAPSGEAFVRRQGFLHLPGFDVLCRPADVATLQAHLQSAGVMQGKADTLEVLRIESGAPRLGMDMDEQRFVVEVDRIGQSICYTKGCFLGQEPIVMARDRGQVNRQFRGVYLPDNVVPTTGSKLYRDGAEVGVITSATQSPHLGRTIALAYLKRGSESPGTLVALSPEATPTAEVRSLPMV